MAQGLLRIQGRTLDFNLRYRRSAPAGDKGGLRPGSHAETRPTALGFCG
jgi:hypothetical protein